MRKKLTVEEVYRKADLSHLNFQTTEEVIPLDTEVIQQKRAQDSIKFGLAIKKFGYNLFVSGGSASKRRAYLQQVLTEQAKQLPIPNDLCYVYNFESETKPSLISLPAGKGVEFKKEMENFQKYINEELKEVFKSNTYHKEEEEFLQSYDEQYEGLLFEYEEKLEPLSYGIVQGNDGAFYPVPVKEDGEVMTQEEYDELTEEERDQYLDNKKKVDILMIDFMHQSQEIDKEKEKEKQKADVKMVDELVSPVLKKIEKKFGKLNTAIKTYLSQVKKDILDNISQLKEKEQKQQSNVIQIVTGAGPEAEENPLHKYSVNVIVDNKGLTHAPVVFVDEFDPYTFFGSVEFNIEGNSVSTDFTLIKSGDMVKANGGYLVLKVEDLFKYYYLWDKFKSTLKNQEVKISTRYYRDLVISNALKPENIPFDVKVILLGDYSWYHTLYENDPEFSELFKVHAIFESDVKRDAETEKEYVRFIVKYIEQNNLKPFTREALECVIEYSSRLADNQNKLVLNYNGIQKLLDESDVWANIEGKDLVDRELVEKAHEQQEYRVGYINDRYNSFLENEIYLIDTDGEKVGEINALTVIDYGDFSTGKPSRLTANTYVGQGGVISVDRNAKMSGRLHDKGVETVRGFLGKEFAQEYPLSLTANITFEQNYGGIDGDSATSTTLYAILSDMSGVPIKQSIGVTGSMNQKGEVQAIGGVNEKTEGFYQACKIKGLTGEQGVIIPTSNVQDLMLSKEVREAVEKGEFHIYAVDNIKDGIEILTGVTYEEIKEKIENKLLEGRNRNNNK